MTVGQDMPAPDRGVPAGGPAGPASGPDRGGFRPILGKRQFVVFAATQAVSLFGDKLDYMALLAMFAWFAATRGWDASRAIATLSVVAALPTVLFGPLAGVFVDRQDRRKVMIGCDSARTLLVLLMPAVALGLGRIEPVFALAFLVFLAGLFFNTARMSVIPVLVDDEHGQAPARLLAANSFMNITGRFATLAGMGLGGLVVDWGGWRGLGIAQGWAAGFYLDSLTYLVSVVGLIAIYRRLAPATPAGAVRPLSEARPLLAAAADKARRAWRDLVEGWRAGAGNVSVLFVYGSVLTIVALGAGFVVLYVPLIQGAGEPSGLGLGTRGVGLLAAVGSVGLLLSSLGYGIIGHHVRKHHVIIAAFAILSAVTMVLAATRSTPVTVAAVFLGGLALSPVYIGMDTLVHESVSTGTRGRIFSTREWLLHVGFAVSAFLLGQLTRLTTSRRLLFAVGALGLAATGAGLLLARGRNIR